MSTKHFEVQATISATGQAVFQAPPGLEPGEHRMTIILPDLSGDALVTSSALAESEGLLLYAGPVDPHVDLDDFVEQLREERIRSFLPRSEP